MRFHGSIVALITPFRNTKVDVDALRRLVSWHIQEGTHAIVACGSTGEGALLTSEERQIVLSTVLDEAQGRLPIIAGCGSVSTHEAVSMAQEAKELGCAAALVVTPYYVKPSPEGIYQHFKALNEVGMPIILYNNPGRSVINMSVDLVARLAELDQVVGIKDSCDDLSRVVKMRALIQKPFAYLSGDDPYASAYLAQGGHGFISVTANVAPKQCRQLVDAWEKKDLELFGQLRDLLMNVHNAMFQETNPTPVKYGVSYLGYCEETLRLPLLPPCQETKEAVQKALQRVKEFDQLYSKVA